MTEDCGQFLAGVLAEAGEIPADDAGYDELALAAVQQARAAKKFVPGLGHPVHKVRDPRTPRLIEIAKKRGCAARTCGCSRRSAGSTRRSSAGRCRSTARASAARCSPTSACRSSLLRGFALLARAAGLLGQLAEEQRTPIANDIYMHVDRNAVYSTHP